MNSYREVTTKIEKMRELGIEPDNSVMEALREIRTPHYKVAFIGKFQVGKSHIINKVFLNDESLLAEGVGLCKTAVTVEINHGDNTQFSYCNGEQIEVVTNPAGEVIAKATAATDDNERVKLFNNIDNAVLTYPNELLQNVRTDVNIASVDNKTPFSAVAEVQKLWMDCEQKDEESDEICIDPAKVAAGLAEIDKGRSKGIKFSADGKILKRYPPGLQDKIYHIPYGVAAIAEEAFADCDNIESVVIPDSVICIGERAFNTPVLKKLFCLAA